MREMHGIFMTINFHGLAVTIVLICVISMAARIDRPHIPFGFPFGDPFRQDFTGPAALGDAKCKDAAFISVLHTGHRPDERKPVGRIGNWAIDHPTNALRAQNWNPRHRVFHIPLQTFQIVRIELEAEILWHRVFGRHPMGFAIALIGTKVQPVFILPQVIGRIHIP